MQKFLEAISTFIALANQRAEHHVGYCGDEQEEILHTISHEFSDLPAGESIAVIRENDAIIGVLGADVDLGDGTAELWGPFLKEGQPAELALELWEDLSIRLGGKVHTYYGFYNVENTLARDFMNRLGACKGSSHLIMHAFNQKGVRIDFRVDELSPERHASFIKLHDEAFPETYMSGLDILKRLDHEHKVFAVESEAGIKGYAYVKGSPTYNEGTIEFIAVDPAERHQGIGTTLTKAALAFLHDELGIQTVSMTVDAGHDQAIRLYGRAGFEVVHRMEHYTVRVTY
ncbi:GNAT family N-acetyltransferase [Bacillus sp. JRC01]|nr:GNAT family N-acetyltransferase [Bacillus sp. JRC01]